MDEYDSMDLFDWLRSRVSLKVKTVGDEVTIYLMASVSDDYEPEVISEVKFSLLHGGD